MHNFLVIGVPLLSVAFYVFVAGAVYSGVRRVLAKEDGRHDTHHSSFDGRGTCDDCMMSAALGGGLWPFAALWVAGAVLATKRRVKRAEKVARRIADLERDVFG